MNSDDITHVKPTRKPRRVLLALGAISAIAGLPLLLGGCSILCVLYAVFECGADNPMCYPVVVPLKSGAVGAKPPRVEDFSIWAPADAEVPNFRIRALPADLLPPFRVEQTAGLCDPAFAPDANAVFGIAVKVRQPDGMGEEYGIACRNTGGGIDVTVDFLESGTLSFPGAERVDMAFEHTGTDLVAFVRAHAEDGAPEGPWQELDRVALDGEGVRFLPQVEAFNLTSGAMVSYYSFDIPFNGEYPPGSATREEMAVRALVEATVAAGQGIVELGAPNADPDEVRACLEEAGQKIQASRAVLQEAAKVARAKRATAEEKLLKKADKKARAAETKAGKALKLLDKKGLDKARQIEKNLGKAMKSLFQSGDRVLPDDLRDAIGGDTFKTFRKG